MANFISLTLAQVSGNLSIQVTEIQVSVNGREPALFYVPLLGTLDLCPTGNRVVEALALFPSNSTCVVAILLAHESNRIADPCL